MAKKQPINNAAAIIERFGGIRPMAAKIDTPVTTVQGWKKRDVIPGTRRAQIMSAAQDHNIDISDLADASISNENTAPKKTESKKSSAKPKAQKTKQAKQKTTSESKSSPMASVPSVSARAIHDDTKSGNTKHDRILPDMEDKSNKAVATSAWITTGLVLLAMAAAYFLLWPKFKANNEKINAQSQQLVELENKVEEVEIVKQENLQEKFMGTSLPDNIQEKIDGLQNQARNISVTVDQLSQKAEAISTAALGEGSRVITERLEALEAKIEAMSGPDGSYAAIVARVRDLENSVIGKEQLQNSANQLRSMIDNPYDDNISDDLEQAQNNEQGPLSDTLQGVAGNDLKAAAILIAFSQFRSSLEREAPFDEDLALLQKLVGNDNPALQENLSRLSAHADGGVLTASGLVKELKQITGDIVVSSLKGDDVSIKEKAKARLGGIVQIEKDGEVLSGTQTQASVAKAQEKIEAGNIEEGIVALESIDGAAASIIQPFINKAKGSLLAEKVKTMLNETILSKADKQAAVSQNSLMPKVTMPKVNMDDVKQGLKNVMPSGDVDMKGLPPMPEFKGLSGGE